MARGRGRRRRGRSGGAGRGRNQKSTSAKTGSSKRLQDERDDSSSNAGSGVGDPPTTRSSSRSGALAMNAGSVEQAVSSAMAWASPSQPGGDQHSKASLPTVMHRPRRRSQSSANTGSASSNGNNKNKKKTGQSNQRLTRAEELQLEADRIPSVKTSSWNPFTLFPEEIWEMIFANLTDSKDMENVKNATPEWRQMYLRKMPSILFQQVLSIMVEQKGSGREALVDKEDYFQWRLVSKSWDQSVQNFIQMHPIHFCMVVKDEFSGMNGPRESNDYDDQRWQKDSCDFITEHMYEEDKDLESILNEMAKTHPRPFHRNPFLSRQFYFYHEILLPVLQTYGRHIWDCKISPLEVLTPLAWYTKLQHWISLLQNLKVLNLKYAIEEYLPQPNSRGRRRQRTALVNQIGLNPLSELKDLIFLKTKDVPGPVFNELISKATNLQKLQVKFSGDNNGTRVQLSDYQFNVMVSQNLTECQLTFLSAEDFTHLESIGGSWPLKKLYLVLKYKKNDKKKKSCPEWAEWDRIFKVIGEKFGTTLLGLKLQLPKATKPEDKKRIVDESLNYRLNLPHVKSLRVVVPNLTSFDFLLPMKSLERLCIIVDYEESYGKNRNLKENDVLKFTGNFNRLFKTNIWEELPKLKCVTVYVLQKRSLEDWGRENYEKFYAIHDYDKMTMKYNRSVIMPWRMSLC